MQFFEVILLLIAVILEVVALFFGKRRKIQKHLIILGLAVFALHFLFEVVRWQMTFIYLNLAIMGIFYFKKSIGLLFYRILGFIVSILLIGISVFYALNMPVIKLDKPLGKNTIGNTVVSIIDQGREEYHTQDPNDKRELMLEIWYPGIKDSLSQTKPKSMWSGLYFGEWDIVSFLTNYLQEIHTHSFRNLEPAKGYFPLILFNHGLQMFTAQNTLLMEHLASHGYVVVSIGHPYESIRVVLDQEKIILPEFVLSFEKFKEGMEWIKETSAPIMDAQREIATIADSEERSKLVLASLENAKAINDIVVEWTEDTQYVLSWLLEFPSNLSGIIPCIDQTRIGIMGMSIGGATSREMCILDQRITAGINIDGLQYGTTQKDSLDVPFMMFASDDGSWTNGLIFSHSKRDYYDYHLTNSRHADLTDMAILWPILKYYGQSGELSGRKVIEIMNTSILNFWERYLKDRSEIDLSKTSYPELLIQTNTIK